jgi:hypothetical protein
MRVAVSRVEIAIAIKAARLPQLARFRIDNLGNNIYLCYFCD